MKCHMTEHFDFLLQHGEIMYLSLYCKK